MTGSGTTRVGEVLRSPSAWLPLILGLAATALVSAYVVAFGAEPHGDERAPARLFQLFILVQLAIVAWFGLRWIPRAPLWASLVLAAQLLCTALPLAAVLVAES